MDYEDAMIRNRIKQILQDKIDLGVGRGGYRKKRRRRPNSHAMKVKRYMARHPGVSLATASRRVARRGRGDGILEGTGDGIYLDLLERSIGQGGRRRRRRRRRRYGDGIVVGGKKGKRKGLSLAEKVLIDTIKSRDILEKKDDIMNIAEMICKKTPPKSALKSVKSLKDWMSRCGRTSTARRNLEKKIFLDLLGVADDNPTKVKLKADIDKILNPK